MHLVCPACGVNPATRAERSGVMRGPQRRCAGLWLAATARASAAAPATSTDLMDAWRAAQQSASARRSQAGALWRPTVMLSGTAGVAGSDTALNGAQFSAPGLGTSEGVAFNTSVNRGTLGRWALSASLLILADEPTAALDTQRGTKVLAMLRASPASAARR